jgi:hypothetical protein
MLQLIAMIVQRMTLACTAYIYLSGINLALDDVEDGDVAVIGLALYRCRYHHVLGLQQTSHDVEHCRLAHTSRLHTTSTCTHGTHVNTTDIKYNDMTLLSITHLRVSGEGGIASHQEVQSWRGNECSY